MILDFWDIHYTFCQDYQEVDYYLDPQSRLETLDIISFVFPSQQTVDYSITSYWQGLLVNMFDIYCRI